VLNGYLRQAAEALGAIASTSSVPILSKYVTDPERVVRETCEIALDRIKWENSEEGRAHVHAVKQSEELQYAILLSISSCNFMNAVVQNLYVYRSCPCDVRPDLWCCQAI
jgi:hypothetical protein